MLTRLCIAILKPLIHLPHSWQMKIGKGLGRLARIILSSRRNITNKNLELCFPKLSSEEREKLSQQVFESVGMSIFETANAWWQSDEKLSDWLEDIEGKEILDEYLEKKDRRVIIMGAHLTSLDLSGKLMRIASPKAPMAVVQRHANNPIINTLQNSARSNLYFKAISRKDVRGMIKSINQGICVWYAPDQDYTGKGNVFAPFFGIPTSTITALSRLAKITKADVIPFFSYRNPKTGKYIIELKPALKNFPSNNLVEDATLINKTLEDAIKRAPDQYLWLHKRFKTRPDNEPSLYQ